MIGIGTGNIVATALGMITRARGVTSVALDTGRSREAIYKAGGNPKLSTIIGIARVMGLERSATTGWRGDHDQSKL